MNDRTSVKITEEKVWMKYYSKDIDKDAMPHCTIYSYLKECNADRMSATAIHYYGRNISFTEFIEKIDLCADAFASAGVKRGEMVSFLSVATPETIIALYALNKIGATVNTIDPRMDIAIIKRMTIESGSRILLSIDIAFPKVMAIIDDIKQEKIIAVSAFASLPPLKKFIANL